MCVFECVTMYREQDKKHFKLSIPALFRATEPTRKLKRKVDYSEVIRL